MQNKYYYLVASLPTLKFKDEMPISPEAFLEECRKWFTPEDLERILSADLHCPEGMCGKTELLKEWRLFDKEIREALVSAREAKKKGEEFKETERAREIMSQETPLAMEEKLESIRWDFLKEKETGYFFDLNSLIIYYLELQILQRLGKFDKDKGESYFYKICEVDYEERIR